MTRPVVVFDGRCGFCTRSVNFARRWVRSDAEFVPFQTTDLEQFGLTQEQCEREVQWVEGEFVVGGSSAAAHILQSGGRWWRPIGRAIDRPVVRPAAQTAYRFIARHRGRLWGSTPAVSDAKPNPHGDPGAN